MSAWLDKLTWDWWSVVGAVGQVVFFSRFMVQWLASERRGVSLRRVWTGFSVNETTIASDSGLKRPSWTR